MSSSLKTILLLVGLAVAIAGVLRVGGLKTSTGMLLGFALVIGGNYIPESQGA